MVKNLPDNAGDTRDIGSTSGSGRSPEVGNGNPLQYSCLENSTDRGAWRDALVQGVAKSKTWLSTAVASYVHLLDILVQTCSLTNKSATWLINLPHFKAKNERGVISSELCVGHSWL